MAYRTAKIQAGSVGGVTWARRQRTRIQARNGLKRVCVRTLRRVSIVRLVVQGVEGGERWRVLFVVIFLGVGIVVLGSGCLVSASLLAM